MVEKIVAALDSSSNSNRIFEQAVNLAKATNAGLLLLHVISPFEENYPSMPFIPDIDSGYPLMAQTALEEYTRRCEELKNLGLKRLQQWAQTAIALGIPTEVTQNFGDPGRVICAIAQDWQADLIIMGRRGRSGLSEFVLGSTSSYVLHHAACSVLVVQGFTGNTANPSHQAAVTVQ